jgi:hypothetical protein
MASIKDVRDKARK